MTIKSENETIVTFTYLKNIPANEVYLYLKLNAEKEYLDEWEDYFEIENLLSTLNHPLINLGLAQHGYNDDVIRKIYSNGDKALKLAALMNRKDNFHMPDTSNKSWIDQDLIKKIISSSDENEKYALLTNPLLGASVLTKLFEKKEPFDSISESDWQNLLKHSRYNILLRTPFDENYTDGYWNYCYNQMFFSAWKLADSVPITKEWANTLWKLLVNACPEFDINLLKSIERWEAIHNDSVHIRMLLAGALKGNDFEKLKDCDDLNMRKVYYQKFWCWDEKVLEEFFVNDKENFLNYAICNENLYYKKNVRDKLYSLTLKNEDGEFRFYNRFKHNIKNHPEWLEDIEVENEDNDSNDSKSLELAKKKYRDIHDLIYLIFLIILGIVIYLVVKFQ
jgi:hypothetical protein